MLRLSRGLLRGSTLPRHRRIFLNSSTKIDLNSPTPLWSGFNERRYSTKKESPSASKFNVIDFSWKQISTVLGITTAGSLLGYFLLQQNQVAAESSDFTFDSKKKLVRRPVRSGETVEEKEFYEIDVEDLTDQEKLFLAGRFTFAAGDIRLIQDDYTGIWLRAYFDPYDASVIDEIGRRWAPSMELFYRTIDEYPTKPQVILVLGGPGSGRSTQSMNIMRRYMGSEIIKVKKILDDDILNMTDIGAEATAYAMTGRTAPTSVVLKSIERQMERIMQAKGSKTVFILDGWPQDPETNEAFIKQFEDRVELKAVLFMDCSESKMRERILERNSYHLHNKFDTPSFLEGRIRKYNRSIEPVLDYWKSQGKLIEIPANQDPYAVWGHVRTALDSRQITPYEMEFVGSLADKPTWWIDPQDAYESGKPRPKAHVPIDQFKMQQIKAPHASIGYSNVWDSEIQWPSNYSDRDKQLWNNIVRKMAESDKEEEDQK